MVVSWAVVEERRTDLLGSLLACSRAEHDRSVAETIGPRMGRPVSRAAWGHALPLHLLLSRVSQDLLDEPRPVGRLIQAQIFLQIFAGVEVEGMQAS